MYAVKIGRWIPIYRRCPMVRSCRGGYQPPARRQGKALTSCFVFNRPLAGEKIY